MGVRDDESPVVWHLPSLFAEKDAEIPLGVIVLNQPLHHLSLLRKFWDSGPSVLRSLSVGLCVG